MEKYYNEKGEVGVIISPGYGAGWSTWNDDDKALIFDKNLIEAVLEKDYDKILNIAETLYPNGYFSCRSLVVKFLPPNTTFQISEYDGFEEIEIYNPEHYFVA